MGRSLFGTRKRMKVVAYDHACRYTEVYFKKYMSKYIHKVGKMGNKNGNADLNSFVAENGSTILTILLKCLCSVEVRDRQMYLFLESNKKHLEDLEAGLVKDLSKAIFSNPNNAHINDVEYEKVLALVVRFAIGLRKELNAATSVAKTKLQEYWKDRIPPMLIILGCVLAGKVYLDARKINEGTSEVVLVILNLVLTTMAFAGAFYMIYVRLPHAVDGAAKQKASDYYLLHKDTLGKFCTDFTPGSNLYYTQVAACFDATAAGFHAAFKEFNGLRPEDKEAATVKLDVVESDSPSSDHSSTTPY